MRRNRAFRRNDMKRTNEESVAYETDSRESVESSSPGNCTYGEAEGQKADGGGGQE